MKCPRPVTVDFETVGIEGRPHYPPVPVGVAIKWPGKKPYYYAWGHATGNNCTYMEAENELRRAWDNPAGVLFHNAKFDIDVAETHMGMPALPWDRIHDTLYLLFLENPHSRNLQLKPAAAHYLEMPPDEQEAVRDWLVANQPVSGVRIGKGANSKEPWGKYIAYAPSDLVGSYAIGDLERTEQLFQLLYPRIAERGMVRPYDRERELMPILLESERNGVRVAHTRLRRDIASYRAWLTKIDAWLIERLGNPVMVDRTGGIVPLNLDSPTQLADALIRAGVGDAELMGTTPGGAVATGKEALQRGVTDKVLASVLQYRGQLQTCIGTFLEVWLAMADASGGYIYTNWNQVRGEKGGTRTGRLSSSPNFQNIPKEFAPLFAHEGEREDDLGRRALLPMCPWSDLPPLPLCRSYIVPYSEGEVLVGRDYSQQEPRILAHFEDGKLKEQYLADPWIDYHNNARDNLERVMGRPYKRKQVKNVNLGIIYGQGVASLAVKNGSTEQETKEIRDAIYAMYPGLRDMYDDMRRRARANESIRTWGGREYYCEPAIFYRGRRITFDYKLVNVLIQSSAADCTKEAMIRFRKRLKSSWRIILQVHDEIVLSVPPAHVAEAQEILRQCMESVEFDVAILSEGAYSNDNWSAMKDWDKKGIRV